MQQPDLETMTQVLAEGLECGHRALYLHLLRLLAERRPVSPEHLASALHRSRDEVREALRESPNVEFDHEGNIVGSGLTLLPTPHHFHVNGHELFTWCALDALVYPVVLRQPAHVQSTCPATGDQIRLIVTPEGIQQLDPPETVVSLVLPAPAEARCDVRGTFCNHVHFLRSPQVASAWLSHHRGAVLLTVDEAFQLGRMLAQRRYTDALGT